LSSVLERPGELVTRRELCQKLWPADTFVDFDHGLNSAVARLRDALSDSAEQPKFIETVPKRGYRFIASLIRHPTPAPRSSENIPPTRLQKSGLQISAPKIWVATGAAVFMLMLVSAIVLARSYSKMPPSAEAGISLQKSGHPSVPAYSPDGKQVAFRQNEGRESDGIFTALVGYIDQNADVTSVCEGTGKNKDLDYYLARRRRTGDFHGQAPVLWCASALLR
jgi:hypothetical protein